MALPSMDGLFCNIPAVFVRGHKLIRHVGSSNFVFIGLGDFVVEYLVLWSDALYLRSFQGLSPCQNLFSFRSVFHCFDPGGIAVNFMDNHLVVVATAGGMGDLSGLIGGHCIPGIVSCNEKIVLPSLLQGPLHPPSIFGHRFRCSQLLVRFLPSSLWIARPAVGSVYVPSEYPLTLEETC